MRARSFILSLLFALILPAVLAVDVAPRQRPGPLPPRPSHDWCTTSYENNTRLEALDRWVDARRGWLEKRGNRTTPTPRMEVGKQVILLEATEEIAPFDHPFDLNERSLTWEPNGADSFTVTAGPLVWQEDLGERIHQFVETTSSTWFYHELDLESFSFPFAGEQQSTLYVTAFNSIHFSYPTLRRTDQYTPIDAAGFDEPLISPLLFSRNTKRQFDDPEVWMASSDDAVVLTWRIEPTAFFEYELQVRLESSGRILFSYRNVRNISWGSVVVSTGNESWRQTRTRLYSWGTPHDDIRIGTMRDMATIQAFQIDRVGQTGVLEVTIDLKSQIARNRFDDDGEIFIYVGFGDEPAAMYSVTREYVYFYVPGWGWQRDSAAVGVEGDELRFLVDQGSIPVSLSAAFVSFESALITSDQGYEPITSAGGLFSTTPVDAPLEVADLDEASSLSTGSAPTFETFTLPVLNPDAVWSALEEEGWSPAIVDGVAIYQDFLTNLMLYASAYSTVGNPGVDGVYDSRSYGRDAPRRPALLHMNRAGFGLNAEERDAQHVLSHEFGHRWLYFIDIDRGSGPTNVLRPGGGHPAQYVHMPAAFNLYTDRDSSTMGGAWFTDNQDGTFTAPDPVAYYGYAWNELYLMGLAGPEEVEDWYYIENSDPPLGPAYYPPAGITVSGTRRNVSVEDVIRAMGPRLPAFPSTQNRFRVLYVLLHRPGIDPDPGMIDEVDTIRREFDRVFPLITGGRGGIESRVTTPPRRRGVRR